MEMIDSSSLYTHLKFLRFPSLLRPPFLENLLLLEFLNPSKRHPLETYFQRENMVPVIVLTLFSRLTTFSSSSATSLLTDFHVLVTLRKGFPFPEPFLSSWNSSEPSSVCSWVGISCSEGRVVSLDLTDMNMSGSVSTWISQLDRLTNLSLAGNNFTGGIEMANLSELRVLNISNNQFNGDLNWNYESIANLEVFDAYNNNITALLPVGVHGLKKLRLSGTWISVGIISTAKSRRLRHTSGMVQFLKNWEIYSLWIHSIFISIDFRNRISVEMGICSFSICNKLTGTIPSDLRASNRLSILLLMKNFLFGNIPQELGRCYSLTRSNYLSGILAENHNQSSKPVKIGRLNLSNNLLSGPLPFSLSNMSSLEILLLSGNQFSGSIPPSIGELRQVLKLDLSRNSLSGSIPVEIGNCFHLTYLDMSQNNLSGSIPPEISNVHILGYLNVSRNHLNQAIPRSIGSMKSLTVIDFSFNDFSGKLPEAGQFSVFNASSFAGNPQLCGSLLNNPCNFTAITGTPRKVPGNFKLIFALGLLICSVIFVTAAIIKARSFKKKGSNSWRMTAFQKLEFTVSDILECVKDCVPPPVMASDRSKRGSSVSHRTSSGDSPFGGDVCGWSGSSGSLRRDVAAVEMMGTAAAAAWP
ncbi:Detected protein of confused Function [Hibiscus syriacus]|uniref:Detected protein of confused Function n=1 Tax=Hibiscus syriacus TaxID=106335 RepID=A0A6A3ATB8_HIBSY|nr:Detected protein of confused Function [Hibiscus syriacus]